MNYSRSFPLRRGLLFVLVSLLLLSLTAVVAGQSSEKLNADERVYPTLPELAPDDVLARLGQPPQPEQTSPSADPRAADADLPAWASLVFYARGQGEWDIHIKDRGAHINSRRLTSGPGIEVQPDLRRGGDLVVYSADADGDFDLYTIPAAGGATTRLLDTPADENYPVWSPDGRRVAFQSDRDGNPEIYVIDANGQNLRRLTANPDFDGHPAWSPDGAQIAYSSRQGGQYRIWVMNADGSNPVKLSIQSGSLYPAWSPDGREIAFSADGDNNGWLDLWIMSATGEDHRSLAVGSPGIDYEMRAWWPDGRAVAHTTIEYVEYQGQLYITAVAMYNRELTHAGVAYNIPSNVAYSFGPRPATHDTAAPNSTLGALPAVSPAWLNVRWSATDPGGSGLRTTVIEMKVNDGPWEVWQTDPTEPQYTIRGERGKKYSFRIRSIDNAMNVEPWPAAPDIVTTVESLPPITVIEPLAAFSHTTTGFPVNWRGVDPGGSGITQYSVQVRRGDGEWSTWLNNVGQTSAFFDPQTWGVQGGEVLAFRIRAVDAAQNVEAWPADPGSATTMTYAHSIAGRLVDNTGTPIGGATISSTPALMGPDSTDGNGAFGRYIGAPAGVASLGWAKAGYGALPLTPFATTASATLTAGLPPVDDAVADGDFEAADWGAWAAGGGLAPTLSGAARNTGEQGAQLAARPPLLGEPVPLENKPGAGGWDVQMSHSKGEVTVLWLQGQPNELWEMRRSAAGVWAAPKMVLRDVNYYWALTGNDGQIHVLFYRGHDLYHLYRKTDGMWTMTGLIQTMPEALTPEVAIGPDNTLHLVWRYFENELQEIRYSRRAPSGGWSAPAAVATLKGNSAQLDSIRIVAKPNGGVELFYLENDWSDNGYRRLMNRERRPDGSWAPAVALATGEGQIALFIDPALRPAVGPDGKVHFVWQKVLTTDTSRDAWAYYAVKSGSVWSSPELVHGDVTPVNLAVGPDGKAHLIVGIPSHISPGVPHYTTREADGTWRFPQLIPGEGSEFIILAGHNGLAHFFRYPNNDIYYELTNMIYMRMDGWGHWSEPINLSSDGRRHFAPAAVLDGGGNLHMAWQVRESETSVWSDILYTGPTAAPAAGQATVSQTVTIPTGAAHPVLSFFYRFGGAATPATRLELVVGDGPAVALPPSPEEMGHYWVDLTGRSGPVAVTLRLTQAAGQPAAWAAVDDVSLGGAWGDAVMSVGNATSMPGRRVTHVVTVGNQGGVAGGPVSMTYSLPLQLTFVSADPAPKSTSPLRWEWPSLAAGETRAVRVVVAVSPSAAVPSTLLTNANVTMTGELETHNNAAVGGTRLESVLALPVVIR